MAWKMVSMKTPALCAEICERIANGEPLRQICRDEHMPNWSTVYNWINADPEFAQHIARARELGYDAIAEETVEIIDTPPERDPIFGKVDTGYVQWQKNRAYQRMQLLAKWSPKKYGEKLEIEAKVDVDLAARIAQGRKRAKAKDDGSDLAG